MWLGYLMADFRDTLMLPFLSGALDWPAADQNWCVLNADILPVPEDISYQTLSCEQSSRDVYLAMQAAGYTVQPLLSELVDLDGCIVLAHRSRAVNERNMMRGWNALKPGGRLVFCGDKTSGVQPIRKWAGRLTPIEGSQSKHHAVVFWLGKQGDSWSQDELQKPDTHFQQGEFRLAAGMFSADGPDTGSRVLAEHFDNRVFGRVADFGAGWGYLSHRLVQQCTRIEQLDLFESDWAALEAARYNVDATQNLTVGYHWCDLTSEAPRGPFNWVIMNPPFHTGRAAVPQLGNRFIEAAARCLPAGGRLLMVANTNLPYEKTLESLFKKVERREQAQGFKVLEAVKGSR